uniref:RNA-directed RNA polymerase n=1 Tax=Riboviria sp. TaxID=2585031 RepID=A0A6M9Z883_9VIRU|nr:MAG: hypothetical protein 1 [Riboviria sp.]
MPSKTRKFVVCSGFGPSHNLGVYNNNVDTVERAFAERYFLCKEGDTFRPAHQVKSRAFRSVGLQKFRAKVLEGMPALPQLTRQQVVDRYVGPKKRVYEAAHLSLQRQPLSETDARLSSFVKFEKQDVQKAPRVINPRSARFNLELGRYIKHAEHKFFTSINRAFGKRTHATVIKGFNADKSAQILRQKWDLFLHPVAVGLDASKFDMHVSVPALRYEHSFYRALFPGSQKLRKMLKWQEINKGVAYTNDGSVEFEMVGTRSSGDLNTSLGNCLLMCALVYDYAEERGIDLELCNNGDDCVVMMEQTHLQQFMEGLSMWFVRKGFSMVVEKPVYEFERIEFCQTRPVRLGSGWRMVRNHSAVLNKDPMCLLSVPNDAVYRKWLDAVGTCGLVLSSGVPVQNAMYGVFKRHGTPAGKLVAEVFRNTSMAERIEALAGGMITPEARVSYYYAFGVLPDVQKEMERYYDRMVIAPFNPAECEREDLRLEPGLIVNN